MYACTYMRTFAYEIIVPLLSLMYIEMSIPSYDINKKWLNRVMKILV